MGSDPLGNVRFPYGNVKRLLQLGFVHMPAPPLPGLFHHGQRLLGQELKNVDIVGISL